MFWKLTVLRRFSKSQRGKQNPRLLDTRYNVFPTIIIGAFSKYCKYKNLEMHSMNTWRKLYELKVNRTISTLRGVTAWIVTEKGERKWKHSGGKRNYNICVNTGYIKGLLKLGMYFKVGVNKRVSVYKYIKFETIGFKKKKKTHFLSRETQVDTHNNGFWK